MPDSFYCIESSPVGDLLLLAKGAALSDLHIISGKYVPEIQADWKRDAQHPVLQQTSQELAQYFAGQRKTFSVRLAPQGTTFQQAAWDVLLQIPFGQTISYGQQAANIGKPQAMRAIGSANGKNPIAIIIPCHRVLGANGALTGYSGGMEHKVFLLQHEAIWASPHHAHTAGGALDFFSGH
jgi:methylated-DNA-[protein]-cysteine S-methyltransferase